MKFVSVFYSPVGPIYIYEEAQQLTGVYFQPLSGIDVTECTTTLLQKTHNQLSEYFQGCRTSFDLPLKIEGTLFQQKVWKALRQIPYGETRSYKEIAIAIGNPKAMRAVGMAIHRNRFLVLIPCHRVIGTDGSLTGYACGLDIKHALLQLEHIHSLPFIR